MLMSSFIRVVTCAVIGGCVCAIAPHAAGQGAVRGSGAGPEGEAAKDPDQAVLAKLQGTIIDAAYDRVDLEKIIADLRERHALNIHVSWTALEAAGVRRDERIEVRLSGVSLETLLDIVLREAAIKPGPGELMYHVENGVLIITTRQTAREDATLRIYDIADLIESGYAIRRFANTPVLKLDLTGREFVGGEQRPQGGGGGGAGGGGSGGGSLFTGGEEDQQRLSVMERIEVLVTLVQENIEPDGWRALGGDASSLQVHNNAMLITASMRTHQKVERFLAMLRASRPRPLDVDAAIVRMRTDKASEWRDHIGTSFPRLTAEQASQAASASEKAGEGMLFRGCTSGFNGQAMWFSALAQRDALTGMQAITGDQVNAFQPQSETATSGLELIVLPLVSPQSDTLTLDVQMAWSPTPQVTPRAVPLAPGFDGSAASGAAGPTIDQTTRSMRTVSSTTSLRLGEAIALSVPQQVSDSGASAEWEDWLIVRVRAPQP